MRFVKVIAAIAFLAPVTALAKSDIVRIEVSIGAKPVHTFDGLEAAGKFSIWSGPGTSSGAFTGERDFIDWATGAVDAPAAKLARYDVSFYCGPHRAGEPPRKCYVVRYVFDAARKRGFIYLPAPGEPDFRPNVSALFHGVEGNWFRATPQWEQLVGAATT
jgi:hypothetical protein